MPCGVCFICSPRKNFSSTIMLISNSIYINLEKSSQSISLVSYPNFVWGLSFIDILILASRLTVLNASYSAKQMIIQYFDQECEKYQKEVERVFSLVFLDPSSPKLASGSPEPPNSFMVKKPACLGKLFASARLGELQLPQSDPLPINRHPRGVLKGSKA